MGIYQDKLQKIIDGVKYTNNTQVNQTAKEEDVKWFYPLLDSLSSKNNKGERILHPRMQEMYEFSVKFDKDHERTVLVSDTGSGKSGVIYYLCAQWFKRNKKRNIFHLINPLNVLNDQTTYDLIFVMKYFFRKNHLNLNDLTIYLNRCDGDSAGKILDNREEISVYSFKEYEKKKRTKYEIVISCVPSVKNIENKWKKEDCLSTVDEIHTIKYDDNIEVDEDSLKVNWSKFWNCVNLYSAYIRGITATPSEEMFLREFGLPPYKNMYKVPFSAALESGRCVMPCPIFAEHNGSFSLKDVMDSQKKVNINLKLGIEYHKILFSCSTNEEIAELIITNDYEGIFYISTSYFGKIKARKIGSKIEILEKDMTIPEFSNSIETLEEDCYVFHIRQLIAGVNVKGLSGCVLQTLESITNYITTKQTIGRCLRKKGTKDGGLVTFLLENTNMDPAFAPSKLKSIWDLMNAMYGNNWISAALQKKQKKKPASSNQPTPPKGPSCKIPCSMNTYYMEVVTRVQECKKRFDLGEKLKNDALKETSLKYANDALNDYAKRAVFGSEKERYEETKKELADHCNWESLIKFRDWYILE